MLPEQPVALPDDTRHPAHAAGTPFTQRVVAELAHPRLALICGRYEGIDERVRPGRHRRNQHRRLRDQRRRTGAMIVLDAVTRLLPGALGYASARIRTAMRLASMGC
jgi:tRNA (guanine37-N1)-methyltransferase